MSDLIERFEAVDKLTKVLIALLTVGIIPLGRKAFAMWRAFIEKVQDNAVAKYKGQTTEHAVGLKAITDLNETGDKLTKGLQAVVRQLAKTTALTDALLMMSGRCYWISNPDGSCRVASDRLAHLLGTPSDQIIGFGWVSLIHEDDREDTRQEFLRCMADRRPFRMRYRFDTPERGIFTVEGHSFPIVAMVDTDREVIGHIGWVEKLNDGP